MNLGYENRIDFGIYLRYEISLKLSFIISRILWVVIEVVLVHKCLRIDLFRN